MVLIQAYNQQSSPWIQTTLKIKKKRKIQDCYLTFTGKKKAIHSSYGRIILKVTNFKYFLSFCWEKYISSSFLTFYLSPPSFLLNDIPWYFTTLYWYHLKTEGLWAKAFNLTAKKLRWKLSKSIYIYLYQKSK